jgi:hypothetical protein
MIKKILFSWPAAVISVVILSVSFIFAGKDEGTQDKTW